MLAFIKNLQCIIISFIVLTVASCSQHSSEATPTNDVSSSSLDNAPSSSNASIEPISINAVLASQNIAGMVYIPASRRDVKIGDKINVILNYDFLIGEHEVTCGEYGITCEDANQPVADITLFDAILFANAKSKAERFDTVYTYSNAVFDAQGHCALLESLIFNSEKTGYRLPTEAEWIAAASIGWDAGNSWNSANAAGKPHQVCTLAKDNAGFCDFAGNVMEWVNDKFIPAKDTTLVNFIGGDKENAIDERILKGGSYTNDANSINLYTRGDVYSITSSTHVNYAGFRLALGKIPNPTTLGDAPVAPGIPTIFLVNADAIKAFTGTYATKLAFRNHVTHNLAYVDYSDIVLPLVEIADTLNVYHPEISPNGQWVAFSTIEEGISGKSSLYVRRLNPTGSDLVKLDFESAAIPRWTVNENGDTSIVFVTDAGNNEEDAEWYSKSTWAVPFANGKFGQPTELLKGAFHGGINENATLAVSGARKLRARIAEAGSVYDASARDTIWYNGEQACNASLAKDGTGHTAFLDFGGKTGREFAGEKYSTHQRILIADKSGNLIQTIKALQGYTFDHTEWASNGVNSNIVGTLTNMDGFHTHIVLVNVKDSTILPIVQGEDLWHPNLWISRAHKNIAPTDTTKATFVLDPDSAGAYIKTNGQISLYAIKWRYKLELLWKYKDSINTAIVGSSRALHGVIPSELGSNFKAVNFANSNNTLYCTKFFLDNYALPHIKNLKYIVVSLDLDRGFNTEQQSFFMTSRKDYRGLVYDENHNFWKDNGAPEELAQYTYESQGYGPCEPLRDALGYEQVTPDSGWKNPVVRDSMWMTKIPDAYYANFKLLTEILDETNKLGIKVIGVIFPQSPEYQKTGSFGYGGLQRSAAPALIQEIADLSKTYPNFILMDENNMGIHEYTDEMAYDFNHLAHLGAVHFSNKLNLLLNTLSK